MNKRSRNRIAAKVLRVLVTLPANSVARRDIQAFGVDLMTNWRDMRRSEAEDKLSPLSPKGKEKVTA